MTNASQWRAVDAYFTETIVAAGRVLVEALAANAAAGLPSIDDLAAPGRTETGPAVQRFDELSGSLRQCPRAAERARRRADNQRERANDGP